MVAWETKLVIQHPVRISTAVNKMSGSEKVMVGLKSTPDSPKSAVLTHNSPW